jgi:DNA polymerase-3 subunit delta|tara:strand:- start:29 stop:1015 length:987 start_codon:yes stop_codon:yes gene_type:complete
VILKAFELNKINFTRNKFFLLYGENEGLKIESIKKNFIDKYTAAIQRYDEREILENKENFFNTIFTRSFFENEKLIIISRTSDKILEIIKAILEKEVENTIIVLVANSLEKKSKIRSYFEKNKETICIAFYEDNKQTLSGLVSLFFKERKIPISQQTINLLVDRCRGDRLNLKNELFKIENYLLDKKSITSEEILKLTNLAENYNVSELIDNCLAKNTRKTANILNENNYSTEDCILIIRTLLLKSKRLQKLQIENKNKKNLDETISSFRPPIFWKDKEIVKQQINNWPLKNVEDLIYNIGEIELLIKKNSTNSLDILSDFIITQSNS